MTPGDFDTLPVAMRNGGVEIPLQSVATYAESDFPKARTRPGGTARPGVYIAAGIAPDGNIIDVAAHVRKMVKAIRPNAAAGPEDSGDL